MSRKTARDIALKIAFARLCGGNAEIYDAAEMSEINFDTLNASDCEYASGLVAGVSAHSDELDEIITQYTRDWDINRLPYVDKTILRMSLYELVYHGGEVPVGAVIDEAVGLAKTYSTDDAYKYINGILGAYTRAQS